MFCNVLTPVPTDAKFLVTIKKPYGIKSCILETIYFAVLNS